MSFIINSYQFGTGIDADAQAFITAADITDATTRTAIIDLVASLKSNSLWTKFIAIYPMVADKTGGTNADRLAQIKVNLKNPGTFDLTYGNNPTASATGLDFNGVDQWADTNINLSTNISQNDAHLSVYLRDNVTTGNRLDISSLQSSGAQRWYLGAGYNGNLISNVNNEGTFAVSNGDTLGFYVGSRDNSANRVIYKNGVLLNTTTVVSQPPLNFNITLARSFSGEWSNRQQAWASFGTSFTGTEISTLNTIVENFQDALSRGVQP